MAFTVVSKKSGKTYHLHARQQKLKGGQEVTLYYFGGEAKEGAIDALPAGMEVIGERAHRPPDAPQEQVSPARSSAFETWRLGACLRAASFIFNPHIP